MSNQTDKFYSRLAAKKVLLEAEEAKTTEEQGEILVPVVAKTVKEAVVEVMQKNVLVCNLCGTEFKTEKGLEKHAGSDICFKRQEKRMQSTSFDDVMWSLQRQVQDAVQVTVAKREAHVLHLQTEAQLNEEAIAFKATVMDRETKLAIMKETIAPLLAEENKPFVPEEQVASLTEGIQKLQQAIIADKMSAPYIRAVQIEEKANLVNRVAKLRKDAAEFNLAQSQKPAEYQARVDKAREWYQDFINGKIVLPVSEKAQHRMRKAGKQVFKFKALVWNVMDRFYFAISTYALGALAENIEPATGETWFTLSNYNKLAPRIFDAAVMPYLVTEPDRTINYIRREVDDDGNVRDYTEAKFVKGFTVEEAKEIFEAWVEAVWIAKNITYHKKPVVLAFKRWMAHGEDLDPQLASVVDKKLFVDQDEILGDIKLEIGQEVDPEYHDALEMQKDLVDGVEPITR